MTSCISYTRTPDITAYSSTYVSRCFVLLNYYRSPLGMSFPPPSQGAIVIVSSIGLVPLSVNRMSFPKCFIPLGDMKGRIVYCDACWGGQSLLSGELGRRSGRVPARGGDTEGQLLLFGRFKTLLTLRHCCVAVFPIRHVVWNNFIFQWISQ